MSKEFFIYITNNYFLSTTGIILYWIPFVVCFISFSKLTFDNYRNDLENREKLQCYYPTDTIVILILRIFATVCPIVNICFCVFEFCPDILIRSIKFVNKF